MKVFTKTWGHIEQEVDGLHFLQSLKHEHGLLIPNIIEYDHQVLKLEYIEAVSPTKKHWAALAEGLARLHAVKGSYFGYEKNNFIGQSVQHNCESNHWADFFYHYRLKPQVKMVSDKQVNSVLMQWLVSKKKQLCELLAEHAPHPSPLHGDLWSGNVMFAKEGVYLIDPAVYFGDLEAEFSIAQLFRGFDPYFYDCYYHIMKKSVNYEDRQQIYKLYHLLNHYNIFGMGYLKSVQNCIYKIDSIL